MLIITYLFKATVAFILSVLAILLSPLLALTARTANSNPWCFVPGPREFLPGWLQLFSTQDDGVDAGWFGGRYDDRAPEGMPERARAGSIFYKWRLRVWWICRNNAYGFSYHFLGFDKSKGFTTNVITQHGTWDTDKTNWLFRIDTNAAGQKAFQIRAQLFFTKKRFVRVNLGWKLDWIADRVQLVTHVNPFRTWED